MNPLYLSDLQKQIAKMPDLEKQEIRLLVWVNEKEEYRTLCFEIPADSLLKKERECYRRYILAMINNMLVSFGGAGLEIYCDPNAEVLAEILAGVVPEFQVDAVRNDRTGYGVYLNYINRMNTFLGLGHFYIKICDRKDWPELKPEKEYRIYRPQEEKKELELLQRSAKELDDTCICSLDVGGNSIKGAVVKDGKTLVLKEYQWYPTGCKVAEEMNDPMILMVRFMSVCTGLMERDGNLEKAESGFDKTVSFEELLALTKKLEAEGICSEGRFDSIIAGFPDIVVHNKIAGGESFKHQGLKNNPETDYEIEFFRTSDLDDMLRPYGKPDAPIVVLNDGNAASYITSVEQAFADTSILDENGLFACTIGTEMGTGFISRGGTIQHIPMEGFQHVIDIGNDEYQEFEPFDIRSIRSVNTGIGGVIQKYISQMGLFRMAVTQMWETQDPLLDEMLEKGLFTYNKEENAMHTIIEPKDMRGAMTRFLVSSLDDENGATAQAYRTMGKAMGMLIDQDRLIFPEIACTRLVSGGIIADNRAFRLLREGLKEYNEAYEVLRLDEETMYSPLLRSMKPDQRNFNVAIGSAYIGNRFLVERKMEETNG